MISRLCFYFYYSEGDVIRCTAQTMISKKENTHTIKTGLSTSVKNSEIEFTAYDTIFMRVHTSNGRK